MSDQQEVRVKKSMNTVQYSFRSQGTRSKFKFYVRISPGNFHVIDKCNLCTWREENVR